MNGNELAAASGPLAGRYEGVDTPVNRPVAVVGAPCNLGIKPYEGGGPRQLDRAPAVLRSAGLVERVGARDAGDVPCAPYRDRLPARGRVRHESDVAEYAGVLGGRIRSLLQDGYFPLVIGGDCGIVLGGLLGLRRAGLHRVGLVYIDAHADFASPAESLTGSVASMCLSFSVGRGGGPLAALGGYGSLAEGRNVALVGRRDEDEPWYGHDALAASPILDLPDRLLRAEGYAAAAQRILAHAAGETDAFWIHVDADVLSPDAMPAVDSPIAGGPGVSELAALLSILLRHPRAAGLELTIYDPRLDPSLRGARALVALLEAAFADRPNQDPAASR